MSEAQSVRHEVYTLGIEAMNEDHTKGLTRDPGEYVTTLAIVPPPEQSALENDRAAVQKATTTTQNRVSILSLGEREVEVPNPNGEGTVKRHGAVVEVHDHESGIGVLLVERKGL